jgi:phenylacetate-CoA ligase
VVRKIETSPSWASPLGSGKSLHFDLRASDDEQLDAIVEARPRYLSTYPSNLSRLLDRLEETKRRVEGLDKIVLSSEPISDELMARAESLTGAKVLRTYSASEVGLIAYEDPEGSELLVASENVYLEILREDGTKAAPGELGRVVVTTLHDLLRPLVRYAIGDYAALTTGKDGRPRIAKIAGRERSMIRLADGRRVWPYFRFELLGDERPFSSWQLRQKADLSLVVSIIPRAGYDASSRTAIERVVREALPDLPLEILVVKELPRAPNGKFLEVLSDAE